MKTIAVVPAAGSGKRLKASYLKQQHKPFIKIGSKPLLAHTLKALNSSSCIDKIVLVSNKGFIKQSRHLVKSHGFVKVRMIVRGGSTRGDSVSNGLKAVDKDADLVLIHDGARPCIDKKLIASAVKQAKKFGASCVCVPVKPTIKEVQRKHIRKTLKRVKLWEAQTPQVFKKDIIMQAYKNRKNIRFATDDAGLVEKMGYKVRVVHGSYRNIKITTIEDLLLAEQLLGHR